MKIKNIVCSLVSSMVYLVSSTAISTNAITADDIHRNQCELFNATWIAQEDVYGWNNQDNYLFKKGKRYYMPYGQPYLSGHYIGFDIVYEMNYRKTQQYYTAITPKSFQTDANDINSGFYISRSSGGGDSLWEAIDCSAFVSLCWDLDRRYVCREFAGHGDSSRQKDRPAVAQELGTLKDIAYNLGYTGEVGEYIYSDMDIDLIMDYVNGLTGHNDSSLKGYALCILGGDSHIVLLTGTSFNRKHYCISEATVPQLKRTCRTITETFNKYGNYELLRLYDMEDN